jgi:hypothetical protein
VLVLRGQGDVRARALSGAGLGPFVALSTGASGIPAEDAQLGDVALLAPGVASLLLLAWITVAFAASAALLRRRDLH